MSNDADGGGGCSGEYYETVKGGTPVRSFSSFLIVIFQTYLSGKRTFQQWIMLYDDHAVDYIPSHAHGNPFSLSRRIPLLGFSLLCL